MGIETEASQFRKKIEKIERVSNDGTALSQKIIDRKENEVKESSKQLAALDQKLTELRVTKLNIKLHMN